MHSAHTTPLGHDGLGAFVFTARMRITWTIENSGSGEAEASSADACADALVSAVRAAYADMDTQTLAHVMLTLVAPLRHELVTTGRYAAEHGRSWSSDPGAISVTIYPN